METLFQSTLPLRGATCMFRENLVWVKFQSTLPLRGATRRLRLVSPQSEFQSTLPLRGATPNPVNATGWASHFNPHSPCGERLAAAGDYMLRYDFNPHSPCGERPITLSESAANFEFQSTLPLRGATRVHRRWFARCRYFNPHSPCGERRARCSRCCCCSHFNPHSPCGERPLNLG